MYEPSPRRRGYGKRLREGWFPDRTLLAWFMLGLVPLLFYQTAVHEGSHWLLDGWQTGRWGVFAPFSLLVDGIPVHGVVIPTEDEVAFIAAPQLVAALLIVVLRMAAGRIRDPRFALLVRLWLFGACIDLYFNTALALSSPDSDWSQFFATWPSARSWSSALTLGAGALAWGGLLYPALPCEARDTGSLVPVATAYGVLSALAVAFSVLVEHPSIEKVTFIFWVPFALQCGTVGGCLIYLGLARRSRLRGEAPPRSD